MLTTPLSRGRRTLATLSLVGVALLGGAWAATAAPAPSAAGDLSGACTDADGVTVVVDQTDLGGEILVGCAVGATTGSEALVAAGFTDTRDASGLICAIDALPDPCPETFEGSYWSYWYAAPDGEWQTYLEGPDTAVPQAGALEGWRYSDGSAGPVVSPAEVIAAAAPESADAEETPISGEVTAAGDDAVVDDAAVDDTTDAEDDQTDSGLPTWAFVLIGIAVVGAIVGVGVGFARRSGDGPAGQD